MGRNVFENWQESHHFKHILFQIIMCKSVCPFSSHKLNTAGWVFFPHLPSSLQQIWSIVKVRSPFCFDITSLILVVPHSAPILAAAEVRIKAEPAKEGNWDGSDRSDLRFCSAVQKTKLSENKPHRAESRSMLKGSRESSEEQIKWGTNSNRWSGFPASRRSCYSWHTGIRITESLG